MKHREWDQLDPNRGYAMEEKMELERSVQELYLDENGHEVPNPTPMQPPIGYKKHKTIAEQMREMIRMASYEAAQAGAETEEEADDFDVGEDMEPHSPWENDFQPDPALDHMVALASRPPAKKEGVEVQALSPAPQPLPDGSIPPGVIPSRGPA